MRQFQSVFALSVALTICSIAFASADPGQNIGKFMRKLEARDQFNGAVLVSEQHKIIYRSGFGKANFQTGAPFTPETPSNIGSVTKQFTAMAIMMLAERKELAYDDHVSKYIPEFTRSTHLSQITLRELLNHTSGILDYGDLGIEDAGLDRQGLIAALLKKRRPSGKTRFEIPVQQSWIRVVGNRSRKNLAEAFWRFS